MAALYGIFANRCAPHFLQRSSLQFRGISSEKLFSSQAPGRNPLVGTPELPIPGTKLYKENLARLSDPTFLKQASGPSNPAIYSTDGTQKFINPAIMEEIKNQNLKIWKEMNQTINELKERVQQLEAKLGKS